MLDPMKKGALSFHSSVDIRGYQRVNVLAAIYLIMYGKEQEEKFAKADIKRAGQLWGNMFMKNIQPVVDRKDAIREVYATLLQNNEKAKAAFDEMETIECTDAELTEVLKEFKDSTITVPAIEEVIEEAEVVEEPVVEPVVEEPVREDEPEQTPMEEVEAVENPTVELDVPEDVNEQVTLDTEEVEQEPVKEEDVPLADLAEAVAGEDIPEVEEEDEVISEMTTTVVEEPEMPVEPEEQPEEKPMYNEDLIIVEDENKYRKALSGKLKDEVREFKTLSNAYTAAKLCNKIVKLLPDEPLLDLMYNNEVVHILYEEFEGAAYLLSSFRILAVGIATGGK